MPRDMQRPLSVVALWVGCTDACMARCPPAVRRKLMRGYVCVNVYIYAWYLGLINLHELVSSILLSTSKIAAGAEWIALLDTAIHKMPHMTLSIMPAHRENCP